MNSSKKYSKLSVKLLASVLSVITLFPGVTSCANAANARKRVGLENSVVRKIKDVGASTSSFAKRGWIKISTWVRNHPKTTIAIGVTIGLAIVGTTVGIVCYRSHKNKLAAEEEAARKAAEAEAARKAAEEEAAKKAAEEEAARKAAEAAVSNPESDDPLKNLTDEKPQSAEQSTEENVAEGQPVKQFKVKMSSEESVKIRKDFLRLSEEIENSISKCENSEVKEEMKKCGGYIKALTDDLKNGGLDKNVGGYFCQRYNDCFAALKKRDQEAKDGENLSGKLKKYYRSLARMYSEALLK